MVEIHDEMAAEKAAHEAELRTLERPTIRAGASTPWGMAQVSRQFADGIVLHSIASHGGFHLDEDANATIHPSSGMTTDSMRKIVNGRRLPMLSRSCSPPMSGAWRIAHFATLIQMPTSA